MELLATEEMRWFFAGEIPAAVKIWFEAQVGSPPPQPARVDYYLRLDDTNSLGIKLREGRVEIKQRERPGEVVRLGDEAVGLVESWRKWPFALAEGEIDGTSHAGWVGVWKQRRWCLFEVFGNGRFTPAFSPIHLQQGCACELTEVLLTDSDEQWWSLGFEAFGDGGSRRESLLHIARQLLGTAVAPKLLIENSYSYPEWLRKRWASVPAGHRGS
jgi:hypothetical protein